LLVEVHHDPATALSDGTQAILPDELRQLWAEARQIASVVGRRMN